MRQTTYGDKLVMLAVFDDAKGDTNASVTVDSVVFG